MATPTYPLSAIQLQVKQLGARAFSATALAGGQNELGMTLKEMINFILDQRSGTCFKSMPNRSIPGEMQDVYHWRTPSGKVAYVKFCLHPNSKVVVSFKEK